MLFGLDLAFFFAIYIVVIEFNQLELGEGGKTPVAFISKVSSLQHSSGMEA